MSKKTGKHGIEVYNELSRHFGYDPGAGAFYWLRKPRRGHIGDRVGSQKKDGYVYLDLNLDMGRSRLTVKAHRFAWFMAYGEVPPDDIDHINRDKSDNRICNLRLATRSQNHANRSVRPENSTRLKGVKQYRKKFQARITVNGTTTHLGTFNCPTAAHISYLRAALEHYGDFASS